MLSIPDSTSLGDFYAHLVFTHTLASQFDFSRVVLLYRKDADFKAKLVQLLPNALVLPIGGESSFPSFDLISELPETDVSAQIKKMWPEWFDQGLNQFDFLLSGNVPCPPLLSSFERVAPLAFPPDLETSLASRLVAAGVS